MSDAEAAYRLITRRRSVRSFTGEAVTFEQIDLMLKAAMAAPSARNRQPWRFLVVTDRQRMDRICAAHPYAGFGEKAGAVILPFFEQGEGQFYSYQDCAAATENLLIMAAALGLGTTWCGMNNVRQDLVRPLTGLPASCWIFAVIPVGVPAEDKPARTQFDPAKVYWEQYEPTK